MASDQQVAFGEVLDQHAGRPLCSGASFVAGHLVCPPPPSVRLSAAVGLWDGAPV